jgi:hypothetical protein
MCFEFLLATFYLLLILIINLNLLKLIGKLITKLYFLKKLNDIMFNYNKKENIVLLIFYLNFLKKFDYFYFSYLKKDNLLPWKIYTFFELRNNSFPDFKILNLFHYNG